MATVVLTAEHRVDLDPWAAYEAMASSSWLFSAKCDRLIPGAFISMSVPFSGLHGDFTIYARISTLTPGREIVADCYLPWHGRLRVRFRPDGDRPGRGTRIRVLVEVEADGVEWLARRAGARVEDRPATGALPIGLVTSKSGPGAIFAQSTEHAARLAVDEINSAGGVGRRALELIVGDDATNATVAGLEVERMARAGCRTILAAVTSSSFTACQRAAARCGATVVHAILNEGGGEGRNSVRLGERPLHQIEAAAPRLMREAAARNWFIVGHTYSWSTAASRAAHVAIPRAGGRIVGEMRIPLGTLDYGWVVDTAWASGADAVLSSLVGTDEVVFEETAAAMGLRSRMATLSLTFDECVRAQIDPAAVAGVWSAFGYFENLDTADNTAFLQRYRRRYGAWAPPVSSMSYSVYQAIYLYADALAGAGEADSVEVVSRIRGRAPQHVTGRPANDAGRMYVARSTMDGFRIVS